MKKQTKPPYVHPYGCDICLNHTSRDSFLIGHFSLYGSCFDVYVQKIEEAAEKGELDELVLLIIWNRLDLARRDVSILWLILPFYD